MVFLFMIVRMLIMQQISKTCLNIQMGMSKVLEPMSFFYLDTTRNTTLTEFTNAIVKAHADNPGNVEDAATNVLNGRNANYNSGFAVRHTLLVDNAEVKAEIPLNRYGFFERLHDELLPNTKIELKITLESDANLVWRTGGADCRVIITKLQLIVPRITFSANGLKIYTDNYFMNKK